MVVLSLLFAVAMLSRGCCYMVAKQLQCGCYVVAMSLLVAKSKVRVHTRLVTLVKWNCQSCYMDLFQLIFGFFIHNQTQFS